MKTFTQGKGCDYEGCDQPAVMLAAGREGIYSPTPHAEVAAYCKKHADIVAGESGPEYIQDCPNCKCRFGVN